MDHEVNTERQFLIAGGVWLVTPMLADARAGLFGAPITLPIELLGNPLCDPRQLSRDKVEKFKTRPDVLTRPVLLCQHDDGAICHIFDGWHRLTALQEAGCSHLYAWSVPLAQTWDYRLPDELMAKAVEQLLSAHC
jgi:hypothetical protein